MFLNEANMVHCRAIQQTKGFGVFLLILVCFTNIGKNQPKLFWCAFPQYWERPAKTILVCFYHYWEKQTKTLFATFSGKQMAIVFSVTSQSLQGPGDNFCHPPAPSVDLTEQSFEKYTTLAKEKFLKKYNLLNMIQRHLCTSFIL